MSLQKDWIYVKIPQKVIRKAKAIRSERDSKYGNVYAEADTDRKWVGEVGEIVFNRWLYREDIDHEWILDEVKGNADFMIGEIPIGVKTVKRKVPMLQSYSAQISARHAEEPVDHFFFCCYEIQTDKLVLLGGIEKGVFLEKATYYKDGDWVHSHYQVRGHEIYNIDVAHLVSPSEWLDTITEKRQIK